MNQQEAVPLPDSTTTEPFTDEYGERMTEEGFARRHFFFNFDIDGAGMDNDGANNHMVTTTSDITYGRKLIEMFETDSEHSNDDSKQVEILEMEADNYRQEELDNPLIYHQQEWPQLPMLLYGEDVPMEA